MKVLLVNIAPQRKSIDRYYSLALLRLSTKYKKEKHEVVAVTAPNIYTRFTPDLILFSTIFLFEIEHYIANIKAYRAKYPKAKIQVGGVAASLRPDLFEEHIPGIEIIQGLNPALEAFAPDYSISETDYSYGFTSRGCLNQCAWCCVPKIEGRTAINKNWKNLLNPSHKVFYAMDNNILACGPEHVEDVLKTTSERGFLVDFNQGIDCVLFVKNKKYQDLFAKYNNFSLLRFAWDDKRQNEYVKETIKIVNERKIKSRKDVPMWYCLYGFKDTPEFLYKRIKTLVENNQAVKLMRYRDLTTGDYVNYWGPSVLESIQTLIRYRYIRGIVTKRASDTLIDYSSYKNFMATLEAIRIFVKKTGVNSVAKDDIKKVKHIKAKILRG